MNAMEARDVRNNIVLIGMPASGKSTTGVILAKILGKDFIDADLVIQKREGARLEQLIEERGVDGFLLSEEQALLSIDVSDTVIATGGSAVYSAPAMEQLSEGAVVVYLRVPLAELKKRLRDIRERGVVLRPGETLEEMYAARTKLYEQYADITVAESHLSIEETVRSIIEALPSQSFR